MFIPPHCPNSICALGPSFSRELIPKKRWYRKAGFYRTKVYGEIPRFQCLWCHKSFSSQTFSINYFVKKNLSHLFIYHQINSGAGVRNIARQLGVYHNAIRNRIARLGKNAIIFHEKIIRNLPFEEDFVADGLESFSVSQYFPDNYNNLVGKISQFVYLSDHLILRRKGRMTDLQKRRRVKIEAIWRPPLGAIEISFQYLSEWLAEKTIHRKNQLTLYTDKKKEYLRALRNSPRCSRLLREGKWKHQIVSSHAPRTLGNPLFSANYMEREIRKDMAPHARETVQFHRNVNDAMMRMSLYLFDHNYQKPYRINDPIKGKKSHGEMAGVDIEDIKEMRKSFFTQRYFWDGKTPLGTPALKTLTRSWETPLKRGHELLRKHFFP